MDFGIYFLEVLAVKNLIFYLCTKQIKISYNFTDRDLDTLDVSSLPKEHQDIIEADSFWCLSKFLDGIQDNYIFAQLGIQHKVKQLKELIQRIDGEYL